MRPRPGLHETKAETKTNYCETETETDTKKWSRDLNVPVLIMIMILIMIVIGIYTLVVWCIMLTVRANSVTWNPHKLMGVELQCSAILVREKVCTVYIFVLFLYDGINVVYSVNNNNTKQDCLII